MRGGHDVDDTPQGEKGIAEFLAAADRLWKKHPGSGRKISERAREPFLVALFGYACDSDAVLFECAGGFGADRGDARMWGVRREFRNALQ